LLRRTTAILPAVIARHRVGATPPDEGHDDRRSRLESPP
jgi:hypothetical protein